MYAIYLAWFTIIYNVGEGVIAIYYGWEEESVSLLGFGCDSFVEVFSAIIVLIQLVLREKITEGKGNQAAGKKLTKKELRCEKISTILIGILLIFLACSAILSSIYRLTKKESPDTAIPGLVISALSLTFMYCLWALKLKAAMILNSKSMESDAKCSQGCIQLSVTLLLGSLLMILGKEVFHTDALWWVDSVMGIIIAGFIFKDGYQCVKNASSDEFDGNCGCCQ